MKTVEYLDACKAKLWPDEDDASDYRLSKVLGMSRQAMSKYRCEGVTFNNETAKKVAEILGIHPLRVMVDMERERARTPEEQALWRELAGKLSAVVAGVGLALIAVQLVSADADAAMNISQLAFMVNAILLLAALAAQRKKRVQLAPA